MIRYFFGILTVFSFLWIQFYNSAVLTSYHFQKSTYIENCENKEAPELKCEGKCHLSKQLIDLEDNESSEEPPIILPEIELFWNDNTAVLTTYELAIQHNFSKQSFHYKEEILKDVYRPPQV